MTVNSFNRAVSKSRLGLFGVLLFAQTIILLLAAFLPDTGQSDKTRINIALRTMGHQLLLRDGDSTSRVLPVVERPGGVFLIAFEKEFGFEPDTLVAIAERVLAKTGLSQYTITAQECNSPLIAYGFEVTSPGEVTISCRGRRQPRSCYNIEVTFTHFPEPNKVSYAGPALITGGILSGVTLILFIGNFAIGKMKSASDLPVQTANYAGDPIGKFTFDAINRTLTMGNETIPLTDKEGSILVLLNRNIGQLTSRDELIQEVWTADGVITGRSLDMFISKLRKKLSGDPDLRITNVHGKGYRLETLNNSSREV